MEEEAGAAAAAAAAAAATTTVESILIVMSVAIAFAITVVLGSSTKLIVHCYESSLHTLDQEELEVLRSHAILVDVAAVDALRVW